MEAENITIKKKSQTKDILRRFFKNKAAVFGLIVILLLILCALFPQVIAPYSYDKQNLKEHFLPPSAAHLFGTDDFGRDIFSRIVYGARISLTIGFASVSFSCVIGILLGAISGYYGEVIDNLMMRLIDIVLAIPNILLAMSIVAALGTGFRNLIIAIGVSAIPGYARIVRASVLSEKEKEYVEAAKIHWNQRSQDHYPPHSSKLYGTDHCAGHHEYRNRNSFGSIFKLYRAWNRAANSGVGIHAFRRKSLHS